METDQRKIWFFQAGPLEEVFANLTNALEKQQMPQDKKGTKGFKFGQSSI